MSASIRLQGRGRRLVRRWHYRVGAAQRPPELRGRVDTGLSLHAPFRSWQPAGADAWRPVQRPTFKSEAERVSVSRSAGSHWLAWCSPTPSCRTYKWAPTDLRHPSGLAALQRTVESVGTRVHTRVAVPSCQPPLSGLSRDSRFVIALVTIFTSRSLKGPGSRQQSTSRAPTTARSGSMGCMVMPLRLSR